MYRPEPFLDIPYPGLAKTLIYIKQQAQASIPYLQDTIPGHIDTPEKLFYYFKNLVTYQKDPDGIEYIQSAKTLLEDSNGYGDCDCFTVLGLAGLSVIGERVLFTDIVGRNRIRPRHIYCSYKTNKRRYAFDLTNPVFDYERKYKFIQSLRTNL